MVTKCYYIPYSAKAMHAIKKAQREVKGLVSVECDDQECWTFKVRANSVAKLERILASVV